MSQYVLLREIGIAGEIPQWLLSERLSVAVDTLSRRLAALKQHGWVEVAIGPYRYERVYRLTAAGSAQQKAAEPYWARAQQRLAEVLGEDRWQDLLRLLEEIPEVSERAAGKRSANSA